MNEHILFPTAAIFAILRFVLPSQIALELAQRIPTLVPMISDDDGIDAVRSWHVAVCGVGGVSRFVKRHQTTHLDFDHSVLRTRWCLNRATSLCRPRSSSLGWFFEPCSQFIPARFVARFDPHDVTCARYVDIFAVRPKAL